MDSETFSLLFVFLVPILGLVVYAIVNRKQEMTGPATVVSHRMEPGKFGSRYTDNWNRMVTFRLSDGTELELYVTQSEYAELTDGQQGQLTWDKDILIHFDPDKGADL